MGSSARRETLDLRLLLAELANMTDDQASYFRRRWRQFSAGIWDQKTRWRNNDEELLQYRDELRLLWAGPVEKHGDFQARVIVPTKRTVKIVKGEQHNPIVRPREEAILDAWLRRMPTNQLVFKWQPRFKGIRPNPRNLGVVLAFACVEHADYLRYCRNPECDMPFFIADKKDQKYCSDSCAAYGRKEAKRRWWKENRATS